MHRATAIAGIYLAILTAALTLQLGPVLAAKNKDAVAVIKRDFMDADPGEIRFNMMALSQL